MNLKKIKLKREDLERILIGSAAALVLFLAARGTDTEPVEAPYLEGYDQAVVSAEPDVPTRETTVYYRDENGYLVPVLVEVPQQEGIARATLNLLSSSAANDMEAASLGLFTVAPAGTTFDLDISQGHARVDMSAEALSCQDAAQESAMVSSVVETLSCFDTVDTVEILVDGQSLETLTWGTPVSGVLTGGGLNLESVETMAAADLADTDTVQLYFPSASGRVLVPVTRTVWGQADVNTAVLELLKGPKSDSGLENALPEDVKLLDVQVKDGVATVNLSKAFENVLSSTDSGKRALRALMLTCTNCEGVEKVEFLLEGQPYSPGGQESAPTFVNSAAEIEAWYPGVLEEE